MPGARCTRSLACELKKHTSVVTTVTPEITRHSPRNGFTAYFALSPAIGLVCHRRPRFFSQDLTPASRRQNHTTSPSATAPSSLAPPASTASRPAFRDDREPPLCLGRDGD
jgi:hypothetical protein